MKKFNVFTCLFYGFAVMGCIYLGFFLGSIIHQGMTLYTFVPLLKEQMAHPFDLKVTAYTPYTMTAVFLTALLYLLVQKTNKKNYRFGKEHGSAKWAEAAVLTKQLGDKSGCHRILSQNLRLSMDTRKTMRNNNIFCIGGSGAGKWYIHHPEKKKSIDIIDRETAERLKKEAGENGNVIITTISAEELINLGNTAKNSEIITDTIT